MYDKILEEVINMAQEVTALPVFKGALPQMESVCIEIANGAPLSTMLCRSTYEDIVMVVNAKSEDMATARAALDSIHRALTRAPAYLNDDTAQIVAIVTGSAPSQAGRDGGAFLFVSSINVSAFFK